MQRGVRFENERCCDDVDVFATGAVECVADRFSVGWFALSDNESDHFQRTVQVFDVDFVLHFCNNFITPKTQKTLKTQSTSEVSSLMLLLLLLSVVSR